MNHVLAESAVTCEIRVRPNVEVGVVEHRPHRESLETLARVGIDEEDIIHQVATIRRRGVRSPTVRTSGHIREFSSACDTCRSRRSAFSVYGHLISGRRVGNFVVRPVCPTSPRAGAQRS